ncbi:outer membrane protein with beta-barrel domain [Tenacibaculum adriaticum]|uniref:Outer membrane protein with beta-barrel domain n=1 Tax=Tenacibaculum adriaticum TaxID=413713 RepID=A0A5S5DSC1_9FLAO|nr:porin family protein [Tenacibaculum adriaticum]TYP98830.1 outer membrane protein with beta-barrel domain [Tenacibaculum adriaticum]
MKKLLLSIAMVAFGLTANAQEVKFGAKAGLNIANVSGDVENNDARTSFHVGGVAEIKISDKFSLQPELVYSAQGLTSELEETFDDGTNVVTIKADGTLKLDYLNVPVIAKYYVAEGLSLEAGPQIGFLLSAKQKVEFEGESDEQDVKDNFSSIDFGLNFGAGYKLENGLNFGARYNLGLTNVLDTEGDESVKNGVFQISVGYFF